MTAVDPAVWRPPSDDTLSAWLAWANGLPLCGSLGIECVELDAERGVFVVEHTPMAPNPNGSVNGGLVIAIADQAMGVMAARGAPLGRLGVTATLHSQFHAPAMTPFVVRATVLGGGQRVRFVEVAVESPDGERYVTCHGTMIVGRYSFPD